MARVVVDVMLKPEILDPQGKAVQGALPRLGFEGVSEVRQGKRFELEVDGEVTEERLAQLHEIAEKLLVQPGHRGLRGARLVKVGVVTFPGSLDDVDAQRAVRVAGHDVVTLWHRDHDLQQVDAVVLPGGFSYGDYLRCGAISRFSPLMTEIVAGAGERPARARHLQRLPDPLRVAPAARARWSATRR